MPDELFDVVNKNDQVIGQELRSIVHQRGLWHRGVHLLLFTHEEKLLVQQRSRNKSQSPLMYDCSVSEHVTAGEGYYEAALRGISEELGLTGIELTPLVKFEMNYGPNDNEISMIFKGIVQPKLVKFDPIEIERIKYFTLSELQTLMDTKKTKFSYWFGQILSWLAGKPSALQIMDNN
jgi:16S rRNA (adenine1518-N6/adenine1519-N6)-dimethyltransferase